MLRLLTIILVLLCWTHGARAQGEAAQERHWAVQLGLRVDKVNQVYRTVDRVVLVPDVATYLDELGRWSPVAGRWPVLLEDDVYTPMFVRRFDPAQLIRRESVGTTVDPATVRDDVERVVIRAWGGDDTITSIRAAFQAQRYVPAGAILTSTTDPAWTAAVALAAGRGQLLMWDDAGYKRPNQTMTADELRRLRTSIESNLDTHGVPYRELGDAIDAITICRVLAGKVDLALPTSHHVRPNDENQSGPTAITDLIGRDHAMQRYAFTGWIFGDEARCIYVAMSSLFCPRESAWFCDTYGGSAGQSPYGPAEAVAMLDEAQYTTSVGASAAASIAGWRSTVSRPLTSDMVFVNTRGNTNFFETVSGRGRTSDVPILAQPSIVHFIHSWSMKSPDDDGTIGGQWIRHGAYAYVGSVHEPYLSAFVPPREVSNRMRAMAPFLVASRWWPGQGPFSKPWKVNTYGDPLMVCRPPSMGVIERVAPSERSEPHLGDLTRELLERCKTTPSSEAFGEAVSTLVLLGRDEMAVKLWAIAMDQDVGAHASSAVLPVLFASGASDDFLRAWDVLSYRHPMFVDMLWLMHTPSLGQFTDEDVLLRLQSAVRKRQAAQDVEALTPHLIARFGRPHAMRVVERAIQQCEGYPGLQRRLRKLLDG